ncbi:MAG TPA: hypothetical protein VII12_13740 [Thermoanaerobaculia bacterium]|jgi:serine/threonine protein kinase
MIAAGTRLGPYEIVAPLGAGGMGEVWRGRDTRLERSVAIKILPAAFAQNVQFRLRFEREAMTISQLNHRPNASPGVHCRSNRCCGTACRSPMRWTRRIARESFTAT